MTNPNTEPDPFAGGDKAPAVSFKNAPVGTVRKLVVTDAAKLVQQRDFDTDEPATWPDGNPKMAAVVNGTDEQGEPCSLWAPKPSSMFSAIADAQKAIAPGYRLKPGDTLSVQFYAEEPAKSAKHNPRKLYRAKIEKAPEPDAFGDQGDPWGAAPASSTPAAPVDGEPPF